MKRFRPAIERPEKSCIFRGEKIYLDDRDEKAGMTQEDYRELVEKNGGVVEERVEGCTIRIC